MVRNDVGPLRLAGALVLVFLLPPAWAASASGPARPNVVLIILDDMNDWVGALGEHPQARTPRIDALAAEGTLFTNAHAAAPLCHPSRVSFMTGISPGRSGVKTNQEKPWRNHLPHARSLNQMFREAGYVTAGFGKIYHGNVENQDLANWDVFTPKPHGAAPPDAAIPINGLDEITRGGPGGGDWGIVDAPDAEFADHIIASLVEDFIRQRDPADPRPFFVALGLRSTHSPWYVPPHYFARIAGGDTDRIILPAVISNDLGDVGPVAIDMAAEDTWREFLADPAAVRWGVHSYLAAGAFADDQVGRVLDALDAAGNADDTIVVLLSDHGYHLGEKQTWQKNKLWEEDSRVPMVFRLPPGLVAAVDARIDKPVSIAAVFPTLLELAGIPPPDYPVDDPLYRVDYRSLVPLLDTQIAAYWAGPAVTYGRNGNLTLRHADARLTLYRDHFLEYYDRLADPGEWFNTALNPQYADRVRLLGSDARRFLSGEHAPFGFRETCGAPVYDAASEAGMFVWLDCEEGERVWHLRVSAGVHDALVYHGELSSDAGFTWVTPAGLGADDVLAEGLTFTINVVHGESAGIDFTFPKSAATCLDVTTLPAGTAVHFGGTRFPAANSVDLQTLEDCGARPIAAWSGAAGGVSASGNRLNYTGTPQDWGQNSIVSLPLALLGAKGDFEVAWTVASDPRQSEWTVGFGETESGANWRDVEFGVRSSNGTASARQNGDWIGGDVGLEVGDRLGLRVSSGQLEFLHNGQLFAAAMLRGDEHFYIDTSFNSGAIVLDEFVLRP